MAGLDQKAREMRPADQPLAGHELERALIGARNPGFGQRLADASRALQPTGADRCEAVAQGGTLRVDAQRQDVQGDFAPAHRELRAGNQTQVGFAGRGLGLGQAGELVVVGQGQDVNPPQGGALDERGGRQQPVGVGRMAMEVVT